MSNFRHSRVWSWQRRIPMVEGAWPARVAVTLTASPPRSSSPLPRRPKRPPPPRLSSPLPKLKYNLGRQSSVQHRISLIPFSCQVKLYQDWGWKNFSAHSCCGFMYYLKGRHIKNRLWLVIFLVVIGEAPPYCDKTKQTTVLYGCGFKKLGLGQTPSLPPRQDKIPTCIDFFWRLPLGYLITVHMGSEGRLYSSKSGGFWENRILPL